MRATVRADRGVVVFHTVEGVTVPTQPWPQKFHVTRTLLSTDAVEVRPLTLTGFAKGVAQNFVTMNLWRACWILRGLGFLSTEECARYRWRDLTPRFWRYHELRRFRWVRWAGEALRRGSGTTRAALQRLIRSAGRS